MKRPRDYLLFPTTTGRVNTSCDIARRSLAIRIVHGSLNQIGSIAEEQLPVAGPTQRESIGNPGKHRRWRTVFCAPGGNDIDGMRCFHLHGCCDFAAGRERNRCVAVCVPGDSAKCAAGPGGISDVSLNSRKAILKEPREKLKAAADKGQ